MTETIHQGNGPQGQPPAPPNYAPVIVPAGHGVRLGWFIGLAAIHVVLGILCKESRWVGFAHAVGTLVFGLYLVLAGRPRHQIAYWAAYAVGAEVLWRLSRAPLPWEYGKYAVSLVLLAAFLRSVKRGFAWIPVIYFVLLLPAVAQTLCEVPLKLAKDFISFYLSGPFCMAICALFFSQLELDSGRLQRLISWLVFPIASIAAAALFGLGTSESIEFGSGSSFDATGGFGPNQVSAILGLGALYLVLMALSLRLTRELRLAFVLIAVWFCAHAALSFSRTGIYLFGAGLLLATPFLSLRRLLHPLTILAACLAIIAGVGAWIYLERFTGGRLGERFAAVDLTGRDRIARQDLELWGQNIVFGTGVGMSGLERDEVGGTRVAAHTEYTRLLAEHGLLGIVALLLLLSVAALNVLRRRPSFAKPVFIAGTVWAMLYLAVSGMRTAAPAFLIGLGLARATAAPFLTPKRRRGMGRHGARGRWAGGRSYGGQQCCG
jgi:hypothetical protein